MVPDPEMLSDLSKVTKTVSDVVPINILSFWDKRGIFLCVQYIAELLWQSKSTEFTIGKPKICSIE